MKKLGIYIHIPFCRRRCNYCGFYSKALDSPRCVAIRQAEDAYVRGLIAKIVENGAKYGKRYLVDSLFIGGGTPSIFSAESISKIIGTVGESFDVTSGAEITIEGNPESLNREKLEKYLACGINRLSMGVQSFDDEILKSLGRCHTRADAVESFELAKIAGFGNVNIDLMFAIPGQSTEKWEKTLKTAVELDPEHISFYGLQIEEGTPFYRQYMAGELDFVPEETDRKMYHAALSMLKNSGFEHYEISNAAKPGFRCAHNLKYWSFDDYLGIGDSAASFMDGVRFSEKLGGEYGEYHVNGFKDDVSEFMFTGLRKVEGISKAEFGKRFGKDIWEVYVKEKKYLRDFFERGQIVEEGDTLKLTESGFDVSNSIMALFV